MVDASGTNTYQYDERDRLIVKATPQGTLNYTWNENGNLESIKSSNTNGTDVEYRYDALNRLSQVVDAQVGTTRYHYDDVGNLAEYTYPNGVTHSYTYDSLNRLTNLSILDPQSSILNSYAYTLGKTGNRLSVAELSGRTVQYGYDKLYRLTNEVIASDSSAINGTIGYIYDPVGNRLTRTTIGHSALPPSATYSYDANDRLTSDRYDANGNTTNSGGNADSYDFENHLTSRNGGAVQIVYDGDGNRVRETAHGVTTTFLVDDRNPTGYAQVLEEIRSGTVVRSYCYGLDLIAQMRFTTNSSPVTFFYGYDGHSNTRFLIDTSGAVTDTYDYDAFR